MNKNQLNVILNILLLFSIFMLTACKEIDEPIPETRNPVTANRTVLVYMVASNSLGDSFDSYDLSEMVQAAAAGDINNGRLLVYHVPKTGVPVLKEVTAAGFDTLKVYTNTETSLSVERFRQVISDTKTFAPALDYGMILWSHATGWLEDSSETDYTLYSFGIDKGKKMNNTDLANALRGQDVDFLYFDCCYMSCVEVAYQMRDVTKTFVGSVTELPADGMPYDQTLKYFFKEDGADLVGAARTTYEYYSNSDDYNFFTISVIDETALDNLAEAACELYSHFTFGIPSRTPQLFASSTYYYDLRDYAKALVEDFSGDEDEKAAVEEAYNNFSLALDDAVLYKAGLPMMGNVYINTNCGLSTYVLRSAADITRKNYQYLDWYHNVVSVFNK
jgi:hypothetical protein